MARTAVLASHQPWLASTVMRACAPAASRTAATRCSSRSGRSPTLILNTVMPSARMARITVDANQGWWDAKTAVRAIKLLEPYDIEFVEQPVRMDDLEAARWVRGLQIVHAHGLFHELDVVRLEQLDGAHGCLGVPPALVGIDGDAPMRACGLAHGGDALL